MSEYGIGARYVLCRSESDWHGIVTETYGYRPHLILPSGDRYPFMQFFPTYREALKDAERLRCAWVKRDSERVYVLDVNSLDIEDGAVEEGLPPSLTKVHWDWENERMLERQGESW